MAKQVLVKSFMRTIGGSKTPLSDIENAKKAKVNKTKVDKQLKESRRVFEQDRSVERVGRGVAYGSWLKGTKRK